MTAILDRLPAVDEEPPGHQQEPGRLSFYYGMVLIDNAHLDYWHRGDLSGLWKVEGSRALAGRVGGSLAARSLPMARIAADRNLLFGLLATAMAAPIRRSAGIHLPADW